MAELEKLFLESKGKPVLLNGTKIQLVDEIEICSNATLIVQFREVNSSWRQGISFDTKGTFRVNGQTIKNGLILWQDTAPTVVKLEIASRNCILKVHNVWDVGDGIVHAWHNGAGMVVSKSESSREYCCNDGFDDEDFNELKFAISFIEAKI